MFARLMGLQVISPQSLQQLLQTGSVTIIDVNSRQSWIAAHIPGAISLDPLGFETADLPVDKNSVLVFYCSNFMCRKAPNAARRAKSMGYRDVRVMSAGITGWLNASLPTEPGNRHV